MEIVYERKRHWIDYAKLAFLCGPKITYHMLHDTQEGSLFGALIKERSPFVVLNIKKWWY